MLLMQLESSEKFDFIFLANYIARIDGTFSKREENILEEFCLEMGIENIIFEPSLFDFDDTIKKFKTSKSRKIVLMNLMMLIHIDDNFDIYEHKLADMISEKFNFSDKDMIMTSQWGKIASANYIQALTFIE